MELYREEILENYKNPTNKGKLADPTQVLHKANPLCGDAIDLYLKIEDGVLTDISFEGHGCAISVAASSLLTQKVKGMSVEAIKAIPAEEIAGLFGQNLSINRRKCALLSYNSLIEGLDTSPN